MDLIFKIHKIINMINYYFKYSMIIKYIYNITILIKPKFKFIKEFSQNLKFLDLLRPKFIHTNKTIVIIFFKDMPFV